MKKITLLLLSLLCSSFLHSQVQLISEKIQENAYIINLNIPDNHRLIQKGGRTVIEFQRLFDESKPGYFSNSSFDIFVALPANSSPKTYSKILQESKITAIPNINPSVEIIDEEGVHYTESSNIIKGATSVIKLNGYLWLENQYCAHISINPYLVDDNNRTTNKITEIEIGFHFENELAEMQISHSPKTGSAIINFGKFQSTEKHEWLTEDSDSWIDYNLTYIKVGTVSDDVFRLNYNDFLLLGINVPSINPKTFRIFKLGVEVPIFVEGENDNTFDPLDFIEFAGERNMGGKHRELNSYGTPYNEYLDRYSDTTIYWITWNGVDGKRVEIGNNGTVSPALDTLKYYHEVIHYEKNNWFDFSMADLVRREMPYWYENKTWHEGNLGVGVRNLTFATTDVFPDRPFFCFSKQQSYASSIVQNAHLLAISVNNLALQDSGYVDKYQQKLLQGIFNSNSLNNGNNTLKVHSFATNALPNLCIFDWYEVEYPRYLKTYSDSLNFSFPLLSLQKDLKGIKITNVLSNSPSLWKYGSEFKKYNLSVSNNEILLFDSLNNKDKFILTTNSKIKKPIIYYAKQFVNLRSPQNAADYITITHNKFKNKTDEYAAFIANQYSLGTKVIDVKDIYDEFSYGFFNPEAIRDFLKATHTFWQSPLPKYVCLIGGATYDYHGNKIKFMGLPPKYNYVPSFGASVSDNWFVTWDTTGAYIPQMNIGRIPVKSVEELDYYMNKHIAYVSKSFDDWNKRFMFFSGGNFNDPNQLNQLKGVNDFVINNYVEPAPIGGNFKHFYKTANPNTNFGPYSPEEIQQTINNGAVFISYLGHSGTQTWDNSITQPVQLKNNVNRNPLITDFGCSTARFAEPDITSFSQLFLLDPDGQAISYIGNASLGFLSTSVVAPKLFYKQVLQDSVYNISEALKRTKLEILQNYGSSGVYKLFALTNTVIGDPIINLPIPPKPNLSIQIDDVKLIPASPSDNLDSVEVSMKYFNFGTVKSDSFKIIVLDEYSDTISYSLTKTKLLPNYTDSLKIKVPIKSKPGEHFITITLDSENQIDEISESDNQIRLSYIVSSSAVRSTIPHEFENRLVDSLIFVNPVSVPLNDSMSVEISENDEFNNYAVLYSKFSPFFTSIKTNNLFPGRRYWLRSKIINSDVFGAVQSFCKGEKLSYSLSDSISFASSKMNNLQRLNGSVVFDTVEYVFSAISAGFLDGSTANILVNSQNFIPENTWRGHHICLFDDSTYSFKGYYIFDLLGGGAATTTAYINFLDTLSMRDIIIIAVGDEGRVASVPLKNQIKSLGSIYIDSLVFRGSWAIIGKKGAVPGSVPEAFTKPGSGRAEIDTTIYKRFNSGSLVTSEIGPVGLWDSLKVEQNLKTQTTIKYKPIVIKSDGTADTLDYLPLSNSAADLKFINAKIFPKMKLIAEFESEADTISPALSSLSVEYKTAPELGLNYQTVSAVKDSIFNGDSLSLLFSVMNAGETPADSCNVILQLFKPNNSVDTLINSFVKIPAFGGKKFEVQYVSNMSDGNGNYAFNIFVDPQNKITELYKDNNIYKVSFVVRPDTVTSISQSSFDVKVDGKEIYDGDFVASTPKMEITLHYPSWFPINDTSAIKISLSGKQVYNNQFDDINYDTIKREISFVYKPTFSDGEYLFRIFAKNVNGLLESQPAYEVVFNVMNEANILDVYNYPNPFKSNTHFTFRLTQKPDELKIKIYTVAGRLIRELLIPAVNLCSDFNKVEWDGRDQDGDLIANGVYIYKVIMKKNDETKEVTQKLSVVR